MRQIENLDEIDLLTYSPKYSNKQKLIFKIIEKNNDKYTVKFEIDNLIKENVSRNLILLGECFHPNIKYKSSNKHKNFWHNCYIEAIKYESRGIFQQKSSLYSTAYGNNWINDIYQFINEKEKIKQNYELNRKNRYKFEECKEKALLCSSRIEFQKLYYNYYRCASLNNWLDNICNHMKNPNIKYNINIAKEKALLFKNRKSFSEAFPSLYKICWDNNWLDIICSHMVEPINQLEIPRLIYAYIFEETKTIYIGLTKELNLRIKYRKYKGNDIVMQYINKTKNEPKIIKLTDFIPAEKAQIKEQEFINKYRSEGWNILNIAKGGSLGGYVKIII